MRGWLELASLGNPTREEYEAYVRDAAEEADRVFRLVRAMQAYFAIAPDPRLANINLLSLINEQLENVRPLIESKSLRHAVSVPAGLQVSISRESFDQALSNVLGHLMHHSPAEGEIRITATGVCEAASVLLESDAVWHKPEDRDVCLDLLQAGEVTTEQQFDMALARRIMEVSGGALHAEQYSWPRRVFRLVIPLATVTA